jgi:hypothetical protein
MPSLLTMTSQMTCPHGGTVQAVTTNTRTRASGMFVLRATDTFTVLGCSLLSPCVQVVWPVTALRSTVSGDPVLNEDSIGACLNGNQAMQGYVTVVPAQLRVSGT